MNNKIIIIVNTRQKKVWDKTGTRQRQDRDKTPVGKGRGDGGSGNMDYGI